MVNHYRSTRLRSLTPFEGHRPPSSRRAGIYSPVALLSLAHRHGMTSPVRVSLYCPHRLLRNPNLARGQGRNASLRRSLNRSPRIHSWIEGDAPGVSIESITRGGARSHWLVPVNDVHSPPQTPSSTERLINNAVLQRNTPLLFVSPSTPMLDWTVSPMAQSSNTTVPNSRITPPSDNVTDVLTFVDMRPEEAGGGAAFTPSINCGIGGQVSDQAAQQLTCNPLNLFMPSAGDSLRDGEVNVPLIPCDILPIVSNTEIHHVQDDMASDSDSMEELVVTVHLARNLSLSPCRATLLPTPVSPTRSTFSLSGTSTEATAVGRNPTSVNDLNGSNPAYNKKPFPHPAAERASSEQRVPGSPRRLIKKRAPTVVPPHEVRPRGSSLSTSNSDHTDALTKREKDRSSGFATRRFVKHIPRFSKHKEERNDIGIAGPERPASLRRTKNVPRQPEMALRESFDEFEWPFKEQRGRIGNQDVVIVQRRTYVEVEEISRVRPVRLKMRSLESL